MQQFYAAVLRSSSMQQFYAATGHESFSSTAILRQNIRQNIHQNN
jgi:hypothetical protein